MTRMHTLSIMAHFLFCFVYVVSSLLGSKSSSSSSALLSFVVLFSILQITWRMLPWNYWKLIVIINNTPSHLHWQEQWLFHWDSRRPPQARQSLLLERKALLLLQLLNNGVMTSQIEAGRYLVESRDRGSHHQWQQQVLVARDPTWPPWSVLSAPWEPPAWPSPGPRPRG